MKLILDIRNNVEENAADYFEKAKKARKKLAGAKKAIIKSMEKLEKAKAKEIVIKKVNIRKIKKREWFEKFRWFVTSDGFMVVGGRDATTNEIVIKKYTEDKDLVFHTDMAGSPFVVIKAEGKEISKNALQETADFTASFSRGWKAGITTLEVFYVTPKQVSKETNPGEYMPKGAFMIRGKTTYITPRINLAAGIYKDHFMTGPVSAIKKNCKEYMEIIQGKKKTSEIAKLIQKKIGGDLDDIIRALPAGGCDVKP